MMQPPFMMGMLPQMMYSPAAAGSQAAKKVSPYEKIDGIRPGMEAKVTTSGISVKKLPKVRLGEAIEFVKPGLDVTVIGDLSQDLHAVVLWALTHIKPSMKVQEFRSQSYVDLYQRFRAAHERMLISGKIGGNYNRNGVASNNLKINK